jgi:hypothetical protein
MPMVRRPKQEETVPGIVLKHQRECNRHIAQFHGLSAHAMRYHHKAIRLKPKQ